MTAAALRGNMLTCTISGYDPGDGCGWGGSRACEDDEGNKDSKILRYLITSIKKEDILIAPNKMDEVPETNRNKR